ncbi:hypothetical protein GOBAR_DD12810 [Gossypium barbadense]|nr:hypothetical protein GOBAR_DD12810 [Gossypium barbadense]
MADALVSVVVNIILDNLNSLFLEEMGLAGSLKKELQSLESTLTTIQAVLHDAEEKQWKSEAIKNWLGKLKQAAYDLEDVLDDFKTEAQRRRSKVSTFFSLQNPLVFRLNMARKFKNAREKLDAIAEEKSKFHLRECVVEAAIEWNEDRQTSSLVKESEILGRADEKEKILRYLCLHDGNMKTLPESTISLHNLQTLNLQYCHSLEMLPKDTRHLKNLKYLDLRCCSSLTSMPVGLGQLSCLRKLSMFVVGKDIGCGGIDDLKELALVGELSITGLHNIKSSTEAKNANLKKKQNLSSLSLSWRVDSLETCHHQHRNDEEILNVLQPHSSLKKLCIFGYQGDRFPYWMMELLIPNLVEISLEDCEICDQLPPLGKLRFLKVLTIKEMGALKYIDSNFHGDMESSFPSLKVLEIAMAPCLEEWTTVNGREQFPLLSSLTIKCCPKLVKMPMLQSLKKLEIGGINVTLLKSLMMNATILTSLWINEVDELTDLPDGLLQNQKHLDSLTIVSSTLKSLSGLQNISSLKTLDLSQCDSLVSLPANGLQGLLSLSSLRIQNCKKLASLSEGVLYLTSLRDLLINGCPELTSLPESIQHLSSLQSLRIWSCVRLISLPNEIQHLNLLSQLEIKYCCNLMSLPQGVWSLTALETLEIEGCPHLKRQLEQTEASAMEWMKRFVGKRFLLILDYVWNEYHDKWDRLKQALQSGRRGSEVIVTTRLEKVAFIMAKVPFHCLLCLSDDDSWSSFKKRAFVMGINEGNVNHETIGKQIVQRCGGVPLAINAIGSILCFKS